MIKVGINGFGRIGRLVFRAAQNRDDIQVVGINDLLDVNYIAYMLKYDTIHGQFTGSIDVKDGNLIVNGNTIRVSAEKNPADLKWDAIGAEYVVESTGLFLSKDKAQGHIDAGAKYVVMSAPSKDDTRMYVCGVNEKTYTKGEQFVSNASCTTNCLAPVVKVIHEALGIRHGSITTIHDLTNTQSLLDQPHKDLRRARASLMSLIPTTTGSATAIAEIFPELRGKLNGHAVRVPLANASLTDCVFEVERATSAEEVNALLKAAASEGPLKDILGFEERPLVSIDYRTDPRSSIIDALSTLVVNGTQVKVYAWYDNEWGYANRTVELARKVGLAG